LVGGRRNVGQTTDDLTHATPSATGAAEDARPRGLFDRFSRRFRGITRRETWGYGVWFVMGAVIAIPEVWAAAGGHVSWISKPPWPTISGTVGHLEELWSPVAIIVVLVIVIPTAHVLRRAWAYKAAPSEAVGDLARPTVEFVQADGRLLGSTQGGRFTKKPDTSSDVSALVYLSVASSMIAISLIVSEALSESQWVRAYIIYGSIAMFWVAIPSVLAYWFSKDVPFPTLFSTVADLERRLHFVALVVLGLLVVLLLHLALYPWPDIFHGNPTPASP
jgi:hypothetical protein